VSRVEEAAHGWRRFRRARRWRVPLSWVGLGAIAGSAVLAGAGDAVLPRDRDDLTIRNSDPDRWVGRALLAVGLVDGVLRARQPDLVRDPATRVMGVGAAVDGTAETTRDWIRWTPAAPSGSGARDLIVRWDDVVDLQLVPVGDGTGLTAWTHDGSLWLRVPPPDDARLRTHIDRVRPPSTSR
jgi:hypothetical protein